MHTAISPAHTNKMPGSQLLPREHDSETESVDLAGGQEGLLEQREDVDSPMTAAKSSQPPSSGGKLASFCSTLRKTWFVKEFVMMFKLSVPLVSKRWREGQISRLHTLT